MVEMKGKRKQREENDRKRKKIKRKIDENGECREKSGKPLDNWRKVWYHKQVAARERRQGTLKKARRTEKKRESGGNRSRSGKEAVKKAQFEHRTFIRWKTSEKNSKKFEKRG